MKIRIALFLCMFMMFYSVDSGLAKEEISYEKYGKIAIAVVAIDFPSNQVTDYKFEGRNIISKGIVEDQFLFLVKEKGKEINVRVKIKHSLFHKKLLSLTVEKL